MRTHRLTAIIASLFLLSTPPIALAAPADADRIANYPRPVAPTTGKTPSDYAQVKSFSVVGDTKFDSPGARRAPVYDPPATIQVVRPERTIVRDANEELPVILAGLALLVALGGAGFALVRTRRIVVSR